MLGTMTVGMCEPTSAACTETRRWSNNPLNNKHYTPSHRLIQANYTKYWSNSAIRDVSVRDPSSVFGFERSRPKTCRDAACPAELLQNFILFFLKNNCISLCLQNYTHPKKKQGNVTIFKQYIADEALDWGADLQFEQHQIRKSDLCQFLSGLQHPAMYLYSDHAKDCLRTTSSCQT